MEVLLISVTEIVWLILPIWIITMVIVIRLQLAIIKVEKVFMVFMI